MAQEKFLPVETFSEDGWIELQPLRFDVFCAIFVSHRRNSSR